MNCTTARGLEAQYVFQVLRTQCDRAVVAQYANGVTTVVNEEIMNLNQFITNDEAKKPKQLERKVFVAPQADVLPEDGTFKYRTVENLADIVGPFEADDVLMFSEGSELLAIITKFASVVGVQPVVLTGIPRANYSASFEEVTFYCPKVSYHEAFEEEQSASKVAERVARADKSEKGRSSRRETKFEDGGNSFSKFDVKGFGAHAKVSRDEETDLGLGSDE